MTRNDTVRLAVCACVIALAVAWVFAPSLRNGFVGDDAVYVTECNLIKGLSLQTAAKILTTFHYRLYKPVALLSFAVEYRFFGQNPFPYHVVNLILHLVNCGLVLWLLFIITKNIGISFLTAVLFGIHPLHVESVVWIAELKDMLYAMFFLAALIAYCFYIDRQRKGYYYALAALFAASLAVKPAGITLPFVLFAVDFIRGRRFDRAVFKEKIPVFFIAGLFFIINVYAHYLSPGLGGQARIGSASDTILRASYVLAFYCGKLLAPVKPAAAYPFPSVFLLYSSCGIVVVLAVTIIASLKYTRKILFGALFYVITLIPMLQIVSTTKSLVSDRYTYIPAIGIFYCIAVVFRKWYKRFPAVMLFMAVYVAVLLGAAHERTKAWKDDLTLWDDTVRKYPAVGVAYDMRGMAYLNAGRTGEAMDDFNTALKLEKDYYFTYMCMGSAAARAGDIDGAIEYYTGCLALKPNLPEVYYARALVYRKKGDFTRAISDFDAAIALNPGYENAYYNRGSYYFEKGNYAEAIRDYTEALSRAPAVFRDAKLFFQLGYAYQMCGKLDEALRAYTQAEALDKTDAELYFSRGCCYEQKGDFRAAVSDYDKALGLKPGHAGAYLNRGSIYAAYGQSDKAIRDFTQAIALAGDSYEAYYNRALVYFGKKEYDKCRDDIRAIEALGAGAKIDKKFLARLKEVAE
ncbi:MAG: tetratricopeptide repeat protein [Candidatus Omnitrophica bacterium]|nr:tetratricopeptide repeat protein [Candidatus Omnitrophota bacterium]